MVITAASDRPVVLALAQNPELTLQPEVGTGVRLASELQLEMLVAAATVMPIPLASGHLSRGDPPSQRASLRRRLSMRTATATAAALVLSPATVLWAIGATAAGAAMRSLLELAVQERVQQQAQARCLPAE